MFFKEYFVTSDPGVKMTIMSLNNEFVIHKL